MKLTCIIFTLLLSSFAHADLKPGDHVLYPSETRRSGHGSLYTLGEVKTIRNNGIVSIQQMNHPSKYGLVVNRLDANGVLQKYNGESEVPEYKVLEEIYQFVSPTTKKIIKSGVTIKMKISRNPSTFCVVIHVFEEGRVAVMLPNDYLDWVKYNKNEMWSQNDDSVFTVRPVGVYIGKIL